MKTKDELTMLKEWISEQREIYNNSYFESDEKKLDAIERMLTLNEVVLQIGIFEKLTSDAVIDSWSKTNDTPAEYMHVSNDTRKQLDEIFSIRAKAKE